MEQEQKKKRIEVVELPVGELQENFGNPRTIKRKAKEKLEESLKTLGDFGLIVIDEKNNIISGHQRVSILKEKPETKVLCKKLVGYSDSELKAINIKANTHAGEWDLDKLAEWTSDLKLDLDFNIPTPNVEEKKLKDMELIHYEKYDYVMIVCRNEIDFLNLVRSLGIEDRKVLVAKSKTGGRRIKARAIWYEDMKSQIKPKEIE